MGHRRHLVAYSGSCSGRACKRLEAKGENKENLGGGARVGYLTLPEDLTRFVHHWKVMRPPEGLSSVLRVCKQGALDWALHYFQASSLGNQTGQSLKILESSRR